MTTPPRPSLEEKAKIWIRTKYPTETKYFRDITNPERERDYLEGARESLVNLIEDLRIEKKKYEGDYLTFEAITVDRIIRHISVILK